MDPFYGRLATIAGVVVMIAIRAPHGQRSRLVAVRRSAKGRLETTLLTLAWISFLLPLAWVATSWPAFAAIPLHPAAFVCGVALLALGLWIFHRSHADLGTNWSITLEVREGHRLVTSGIYRRIRHPMYLGLLLYALGQALVLPNLVAGPSYLLAMLLIFGFRLGPEERLMREEFGEEFVEYRKRSWRLLPGIW